MSNTKSLILTLMWILSAVLFATFVIYPNFGLDKTMQFFTVFSLEKLLSMDNLLVMFMIFKYFGIAQYKQPSALTYGLIGAVFFRSLLIIPGAYVVNHLSFILYAFAAFLIYSGYKMMTEEDGEYDPRDSKLIGFVNRTFGNFGVFIACIAAIELSDIAFAVDSIPASFGVSQDPFIILSANLFAVMGLRSLYHAVANGIKILNGIEKYIGAILVIVGTNVFVGHFWYKLPEVLLMGLVFTILCIGGAMCKFNKKQEETA